METEREEGNVAPICLLRIMDGNHDYQNLYSIDPTGVACHPLPRGVYDPRPDPSYGPEPIFYRAVYRRHPEYCCHPGTLLVPKDARLWLCPEWVSVHHRDRHHGPLRHCPLVRPDIATGCPVEEYADRYPHRLGKVLRREGPVRTGDLRL